MSEATFTVSNFLGGEISAFAQGRFDKPDYRTSLKICLNAFPAEIGTWVRRPGTQHGSATRAGAPGRVIKFDFQQANPITLEFTDGIVRFRNGTVLITGSDAQVVLAVSSANPAVVQTTAAVTWATGDTLIFPGASTPLLENRQFTATKIDTTHFSLADAITGAAIDGATLGALVAGATVARVQELASAYVGGAWSGIRAVQAETTGILLAPGLAPQVLTVPTLPSDGVQPVFALSAATLNDGPYLDPFINGVQATPSATKGVISITLAFPQYDSGKAYAIGSFVTSSAVNYVSLVDQNVGNTPVTSPTKWAVTSGGAAINDGKGFLGTDVGRLVRLFSEPLAWASGGSYTPASIVSYNPSGQPGATTYYQSQVTSSTTVAPGADLTTWKIIPSGAALWTWGKITGLLTQISQTLPGAANIGDMTQGGGLAAAFDGIISEATVASSLKTNSRSGAGTLGFTTYVGRDFSGASSQKIASVTIFPPTDSGIAGVFASGGGGGSIADCFANLYASNTLPATATNGTLLGQVIVPSVVPTFAFAGLNPVTIVSSDQTTAWKYVWVAIQADANVVGGGTYSLNLAVAELQLFNPPGPSTTGSGVTVEILGPALLYTNPVLTWRLGVYSNTTGWPTCGIYNDGRLYLGGAVGNRFDACVSNGIVGGTINFAPTDQFGAVSAASAISYTFNSRGVNQILWMKPDLQGIKAGTLAGEWLIQAPTAGSISPLNITARQVTSHGSANIEPVDTEHTLVFVQRYGRKLLEYFPDVFSGKFSAPNLADKTARTRAGVAELAYTSAVTPIIWGRDALGALFGITYKRDSLASSQPPTFYGWHGHTLGSGRVVEGICAGPSTGGNLDALTMVTNDAATGIRHVEVLTDTPDELSALASSWFLDDAVSPTSTSTTNVASAGAPYGGLTINGLWHLNGKTVQVFAGGLDCGDPGEGKPFADFVVSNGSVTVPYGDSISAGSGRGLFTAAFAAALPLTQIVAGFTYNSDGQLVRPILPADSGARNGPAFGKLTRAHRYAMKLVNTLGLSIGGTFGKLRPANFKSPTNVALPSLTPFNGISTDGLNDDDDYDNGACFRVSRPFPANLVAIALNLNTKDQ